MLRVVVPSTLFPERTAIETASGTENANGTEAGIRIETGTGIKTPSGFDAIKRHRLGPILMNDIRASSVAMVAAVLAAAGAPTTPAITGTLARPSMISLMTDVM